MSISIELDSISTLNEAVEVSVVDVDQTFVALIPSRFPAIALYERIANDRHDEVAEIESLTNPRLRERARVLNNATVVDVDSAVLQNWNHAPFTYLNPEGTRFFDHRIAALEMFDDLQTALAVSVQRRQTFLRQTNERPMGLDMRVLTRSVRGRFADCTAWDPEMPLDERRRQGTRLLGQPNVDGLLFTPRERPSATAISVLRGETLGRAVQGEHFRFVWDGEKIKALYAFKDGVTVSPDALPLVESFSAA
ncbi:RES family NAD+ phosphorylase [Brevundimonas sp.]|uniref:RES family NAD+ phosphorylase n=1 Tax=Brevundimonas sp. TaxID=1871086 RepID=UPI0025C515D6|nr:RES family NAD+ phosphorylase [Brevundimonas sp.]